MATRPHSKTTKAERNNAQLFPVFARTFSTGTASEFATTADKLAHWLKVDKAYYPTARPEIVDLLETAHNTVRQHSAHPDLHFHISRMDDGVRPFAEPFMRLIRTVAPFYMLFPELPLQTRLRELIRTTCDDVDEFLSQQPLVRRSSTTPSIATTRTTPLSPPVQSPVVPQQPAPIARTSPVNGSVSQPATAHSPPTQLSNPLTRRAADLPLQFLSNGTGSLTIKLPGRPDIRLSGFPPQTTPPSLPQAGPVAATVVSSPTMAASPTIDTMASQSTRPKTKKRKFDFSDVLEEDVKWFKDTRPAQAEEQSVPSSAPPMRATSGAVTPVTEVPDVQVMEATSVKPQGLPGSVTESTEPGTAPEVSPSGATPDADAKAPALDTKAAVASRSPSMALQEVVARRPRSPSGSPQLAAKPSLKRKASGDEPNAGAAHGASASHSLHSSTLLAPSITRRRTPSSSPVAATGPDSAETRPDPPVPAVAALPSSSSCEVLPSPLSSKKKKKKRKGPPGLKILPELPIKQETKDRLCVGAVADDQPNAPGISKGDEVMSEPGPESRSKTRRPEPPPAQKLSLPPSDIPTKDADSTSVMSESTSAAVSGDGEQTQVPDRPLDAVFEDTVAIGASPDAMEVDAVLQLEPNGITPEHTVPEAPQQKEEIPVEESPPAQDLRCDDDVEMQDTSPAPDGAPAEMIPALPEPNSIVAAVPQAEVLDSTKVNGVVDVDFREDKDETKSDPVPAPSPVLGLPATIPTEPQEEDMEDMDPHWSPFESNVIRLLSLERGHPSHTSSQEPVELSFTLTEEEVAQVARWNNRRKTASDLSTSMCVSLVSYPLDQCAQAFECEPDVEQGELDVVGFGRPRPWPQDGSVYVVLDVSGDHGQPRSINVAPPFGFNTIHKPVDLGECGVYPGDNTLHLFQFRDHSDRIFAVVLHHPTVAQMATLQVARDRERALEEWIEDLGRFTVAQPKLVAITVGNVIMYSRSGM